MYNVNVTKNNLKEQLIKLLSKPNDDCDFVDFHDPHEILKKNAEFLIESSEKIKNYDQKTISSMKKEYNKANYSNVINLAYTHDSKKRPNKDNANEFLKNLIQALDKN